MQERYQEEHLALVRDLARLHFDQGNMQRAIVLYKELLATEPTLEDIVRRLYCCYERLGDRNALMREHRHLQEALQRVFGADGEDDDGLGQPERETTALYEQVLAQLDAGAVASRSA